MTDEQKTASETPTPADANSSNGVQPEATNMLDRADALAKRIELGTTKFSEIAARMEAIAARQMLSGRAEAGFAPKTKEQEVDEKVKEAMAKFYRKY